MRKALVAGIEHYEHSAPLYGCVSDAHAVRKVLERDGTESERPNFHCTELTSTLNSPIKRSFLKDNISELFASKMEIALLYFAGHGHIEPTGGYLLASDSMRGDDGVSLSEILILANKSPATNKVIILDSCHSGIAGDSPTNGNLATLSEGLTVLTASTKEQYASEENGSGVFTCLLVDALSGSAANLVGDITPGSVYAHIDQSLGAWEQRPVFKTNVKQFVSLRKVKQPITEPELRRMTEFFPTPNFEFPLDPAYESELRGRDPDMPPPDPVKTAKFKVLQRYNRLNLLVPVGAPHMWHAAMDRKACALTVLGHHYWRLVKKGLI